MRRHGAVSEESLAMPSMATTTDMAGVLVGLSQRLTTIEQVVADMQRSFKKYAHEKNWYTTSELARALGVTQFTIQERWCNAGRIECVKDEATGRWRIPGREFRRLVRGGSLKPPRR